EQLLVVLVPAASDMAAYFCGVCFGKHPIWPGVSPKKSIEGAIAGLAAAIAVTAILGATCGAAPIWAFALLGTGMGIMAQLGDFFESALKRAANVKDSSRLLPGHGGVLDRLDSISFCIGSYAVVSALYPFFQ
ncbi:MAG: phosphatidate cytidylyltransferase, partial [Mailhella sp.]